MAQISRLLRAASTTSVQGFESASTDFHGDVSSNVPPIRQQGQGTTGSVSDMEMGQDISGEVDTDRDLTHQDAYKRDDENQPVALRDPSNQTITGQDPTTQLVAQLLQAQKAGTLVDVTNQLHGAQAEQLAKLLKLARAVADPQVQDGIAHPDKLKQALILIWTLPVNRAVIRKVLILKHPVMKDAPRQESMSCHFSGSELARTKQ